MQTTNQQYQNSNPQNHADQSLRTPISMSQPVLTRSLPSIVGNVTTSVDNVIVSGIYQSYVSPATSALTAQSRAPIAAVGGTGDGTVSQRQGTIAQSSQNQHVSQKFSPPVISTTRPISVHQLPSYSTVIPSTKRQTRHSSNRILNISNNSLFTYPPINDTVSSRRASVIGVPTICRYNCIKRDRSFSQISDKSKKKSKSRLKSKYLLRVINIQENIHPGETIVTFEMMLPMHQMRFKCCLSNEINCLDVSNSVGESGQMPGELRKKDILESLVNTVKKMCQHLSADITSISLNEDYVFHPCSPISGLVKLSDCGFSIPTSLDHDLTQFTGPYNHLQSLQPMNNFNSSCASSRSMSRHPSNEDVSWSMGNISLAVNEQQSDNLIQFGDNDALKSTVPNLENQQKLVSEINGHTIVSTKCTCPASDSSLKVPEYIFAYVKQIVDKLLNLSCKGVIVLPQSNDILTRNFRILEIPTDHVFVGLPCSDSSYNVIKGQKDKDFIIAKDNRDPGNVTEKCVYQKPSDGAVLLDSSGEIQYILKPSLIIPPKPGYGNEKTEIKELPSELTHHKDQLLDCDQIVSVLQSLTQIQSTTDQSKDESFDSPVMLEPMKNSLPKTQSNINEKSEGVENYVRRGSDESVAPQNQPIQVERIFCQYVALPRATDLRQEETIDVERDLPRKQVRSRKISNESLDSVSVIRSRATSVVTKVNESDLMQSQSGFQKMVANNQMSLQSAPKSLPLGALINRMPTVPGPVPYVLSNQNPAGNIFIQNVPHYTNPNQGGAGGAVVMCQNNTNMPVVLTNQNSLGMNFTHMHPNLTQLHQLQSNAGQRIPAPSSMSSSQMLPNMQAIQPSQVMSSTPLYPTQFTDQSMTAAPPNVRQITPAQYCDSASVLNSIIADNARVQHKHQSISNAQCQPMPANPVLLMPHQSSTTTNSSKLISTPDPSPSLPSFENQSVPMPDSENNKPKSEQTVGRFVIRAVVSESSENT